VFRKVKKLLSNLVLAGTSSQILWLCLHLRSHPQHCIALPRMLWSEFQPAFGPLYNDLLLWPVHSLKYSTWIGAIETSQSAASRHTDFVSMNGVQSLSIYARLSLPTRDRKLRSAISVDSLWIIIFYKTINMFKLLRNTCYWRHTDLLSIVN